MNRETLIRMVLGMGRAEPVPYVPTDDEARNALSILPPRRALVLDRRSEGHTLQAIGDATGVSRERVRQLRVMALKSLRHRGNLWRLGVVHDPETGETMRRPDGVRPVWTGTGWVLPEASQ